MTVKKYKLVTELDSVLSKVRVPCVGYMGNQIVTVLELGFIVGQYGSQSEF